MKSKKNMILLLTLVIYLTMMPTTSYAKKPHEVYTKDEITLEDYPSNELVQKAVENIEILADLYLPTADWEALSFGDRAKFEHMKENYYVRAAFRKQHRVVRKSLRRLCKNPVVDTALIKQIELVESISYEVVSNKRRKRLACRKSIIAVFMLASASDGLRELKSHSEFAFNMFAKDIVKTFKPIETGIEIYAIALLSIPTAINALVVGALTVFILGSYIPITVTFMSSAFVGAVIGATVYSGITLYDAKFSYYNNETGRKVIHWQEAQDLENEPAPLPLR